MFKSTRVWNLHSTVPPPLRGQEGRQDESLSDAVEPSSPNLLTVDSFNQALELYLQTKSFSSVQDFMRACTSGDTSEACALAHEAVEGVLLQALHGSTISDQLIQMFSEHGPGMPPEEREVVARLPLFLELAGMMDPTDYMRRLDGFLLPITDHLFDLILESPMSILQVEAYAEAIMRGPCFLISELFRSHFASRLEKSHAEDLLIHLIHHDGIVRISNAVLPFSYYHVFQGEENEASLERLQAMRLLRGDGPTMLSRVLKVLFPQAFFAELISKTSVYVEIPPDLRFQEGLDLYELDQVLIELLCNASKYRDGSRQESWVKISWDSQRRCLRVEDNGRGIADTEAVWDVGIREAERHPDVRGKGYGLYSVRERLARLGWNIEVESEIDRGTRFTLIPAEQHIVQTVSSSLAPVSVLATIAGRFAFLPR